MSFADPENKQDQDAILNRLAEIKSHQQAYEVINEIYPGWFVDIMQEYSPDYAYLQKNWQVVCEKTRSAPQGIILVAEIQFDQQHTIQASICELLTRHGYCVRREGEFSPCPVCKKAIPCVELWQNLKDRNMPVPRVWSVKCRDC